MEITTELVEEICICVRCEKREARFSVPTNLCPFCWVKNYLGYIANHEHRREAIKVGLQIAYFNELPDHVRIPLEKSLAGEESSKTG